MSTKTADPAIEWIDHLPEAALLVDAGEDLIIAANSAMGRMIGTSRRSLTGTPCTHLFPDQRPQLIAFTEETLFRGQGWSRDFMLQHRDGNTVELEVSSSRAGEAESLNVLLLLRDRQQLRTLRERHEVNHYHRGGLLEWRRVEELFKDMERENQLILHAVGEGIYGVDAEGRATFANPAAERMLGWRMDELMGRVIHRVMHHSHQDGSLYPLKECPIYAAFRDVSVKRVGEDWFWRKDGTGFPVEYTSTPILDNGHPVGAVVVFRDISPRLQSQNELQKALEEVESLKHRLEMENAYLQEEISAEYHFHEIFGQSDAIKAIVRRIGMVAPTDANVLITGESGTGKELIARAIHQSSTRRDRPLIRVNCAAIAKDLFESEFFGHVKGAFTGAISDRVGRFELADGGTLFLDEVGEIPLELQGKLLRVLQDQQFERVGDNRTRAVDVRVIAATNRELKTEVREKTFREDLYFRLNVFPIESVPLRRRVEDIPILAQEFLSRACQKFNRPALVLREQEAEILKAYQWPGNVRELENVIERQVITYDGSFDLETLAPDSRSRPASYQHPPARHDNGELMTENELRALEKRNLINALRISEGRIFGDDGAAALLQIKPTTLTSRLKKLRVDARQYRTQPHQPPAPV
ncbi:MULTISPECIES: sigma 54-interacting transcriptional regulator [unclassified Marinobacter]|uniref:sigma 54-interacting transcriptional regulator n=1 Tax=unclassified Marinobacter TaxID=83889 RepID=UPI0026E3548F|nr:MULTISPECIES: sigma 54-interacting transcriptional regulator [unclassified Marinobacter]MDO6440966.1 sigma 54-interacting transcriptional regulator [Marinobacter sp. 2_MG-2023]MDO6823797.1 sigma 54-interacting transcriptional regulator [Marinobacter sp. 1_MG-2023]